MEWLNSPEGVTAIATVGSVLVSIIAAAIAYKSASTAKEVALNSNKVERSIELSRIHAEVSPGRQAMETIARDWSARRGKNFDDRDKRDENDFIAFYNEYYHGGSVGTKKKSLSNGIHQYLHYLNLLWNYIIDGTYPSDEVMKIFGEGICMDEEYIDLYLRAHHDAHPEKKFWDNVQNMVDDAKSWSAMQNRET